MNRAVTHWEPHNRPQSVHRFSVPPAAVAPVCETVFTKAVIICFDVSVLETEKSLVLAEKGSGDNDDVELISAAAGFRLVATMNPGGDFGKKEVNIAHNTQKAFMSAESDFVYICVCAQLSPALRNRFTEIWCPQSNSRGDLVQIIQHNLRSGLSLDGKQALENKHVLMMESLRFTYCDWVFIVESSLHSKGNNGPSHSDNVETHKRMFVFSLWKPL